MSRTVSSNEILKLFHQLDKRLFSDFYSFTIPPKKFILVAVGGTVLEILNLKKESKDIDLFIDVKSIKGLCSKKEITNFTQRLQRFIKNYFDGSYGIGADVNYDKFVNWDLMGANFGKYKYEESFICFELYLPDLLDVCIMKLPRFNERDLEDIEQIIKIISPNIHTLEKRVSEYLPKLTKQREIDVLLANFEKLKALYTKWDIKPIQWWQFWKH